MIEYSFEKAVEDIRQIRMSEDDKIAMRERLMKLEKREGPEGKGNGFKRNKRSNRWLTRNMGLMALTVAVLLIVLVDGSRSYKSAHQSQIEAFKNPAAETIQNPAETIPSVPNVKNADIMPDAQAIASTTSLTEIASSSEAKDAEMATTTDQL